MDLVICWQDPRNETFQKTKAAYFMVAQKAKQENNVREEGDMDSYSNPDHFLSPTQTFPELCIIDFIGGFQAN